eukprot:3959950-Prymnesium_polylepis.2
MRPVCTPPEVEHRESGGPLLTMLRSPRPSRGVPPHATPRCRAPTARMMTCAPQCGGGPGGDGQRAVGARRRHAGAAARGERGDGGATGGRGARGDGGGRGRRCAAEGRCASEGVAASGGRVPKAGGGGGGAERDRLSEGRGGGRSGARERGGSVTAVVIAGGGGCAGGGGLLRGRGRAVGGATRGATARECVTPSPRRRAQASPRMAVAARACRALRPACARAAAT